MTEPKTLAQLRHLHQNMVNGAVRDTASAKRIAEGLLAPAIEALEQGTPPAVAGEPVAWMGAHDKTDLYYRKPPQTDVVPLYATPQPTQAQAGAVPLDEARRLFDAGWKAAARFCGREDVVADGIIGFGACPQFEAAFAAAHGIKGGQHGTDA